MTFIQALTRLLSARARTSMDGYDCCILSRHGRVCGDDW